MDKNNDKKYFLRAGIGYDLNVENFTASIGYADIAKEKAYKEKIKAGIETTLDDLYAFTIAHLNREEGKDKIKIDFTSSIVGKEIYLDDLLDMMIYCKEELQKAPD